MKKTIMFLTCLTAIILASVAFANPLVAEPIVEKNIEMKESIQTKVSDLKNEIHSLSIGSSIGFIIKSWVPAIIVAVLFFLLFGLKWAAVTYSLIPLLPVAVIAFAAFAVLGLGFEMAYIPFAIIWPLTCILFKIDTWEDFFEFFDPLHTDVRP